MESHVSKTFVVTYSTLCYKIGNADVVRLRVSSFRKGSRKANVATLVVMEGARKHVEREEESGPCERLRAAADGLRRRA